MTEQVYECNYASTIQVEASISSNKTKTSAFYMAMYSRELHVDCTDVETTRIGFILKTKLPTEITEQSAHIFIIQI
jgi:hypothetical protein